MNYYGRMSMPNCVEHKEKLDENLTFISIDDLRNDHKAWYVTGVFYSVVHMIESYLNAFCGKDSDNHVERAKSIRDDYLLKSIFPSYKTIYDQSLRARYENYKFTQEDIDGIDDCYKNISDKINNKIMNFLETQKRVLEKKR